MPVTAAAAPHVISPLILKFPHVDPVRAPAIPLAPEFEPCAGGGFEVQAHAYSAALSSQGTLSYYPQSNGTPDCALTLALASISRGATNYLATPESAAPHSRGKSVEIERLEGLCRERYSPRGEGIEQEFVFEKIPAGDGDLNFILNLANPGLFPAAGHSRHNGGIAFSGPDGKTVVRYGQIVVRDARGRGIPIEPKLGGDLKSISFAIPETWLKRAALPIVVDPLVGNNIVISGSSQMAQTVDAPTIATGNSSALIAWVDYSAGANLPVVGASILSASGLASAPFPISDLLGRPRPFRFQRTLAASDGSNWLVIWSDDRVPGKGIRGALVTSTGSLIGGQDFLISNTSGVVEEDPLVTFDGTDFWVAWQDLPANLTSGSQIYFTRVTTAGVVAANQAVFSALTTPAQSLEFLSPQLPGGDVLMLFRENAESPAQTRGMRVAPDGTVRDPGGTSLFKEILADGGFGRPIGVTFVNGAWNILSSFDQTADSSIFLHKLSADGAITPPSGTFAEMGVGPTGFSTDSFATVFGGNGEWLFIRDEKVSSTEFHLLGKRVTFDGQDLDPVLFQIDTAAQGILRNAVAAPIGGSFAVTWVDGRDGSPQPADAVEIAAAIVDSTFAGTAGTELHAVITASPTSGEAPLTTSFSSALSQGTYDSITWNFGDGTTSTDAQPSHTYRTNGTYVAQLKLTQGAYAVFDTILILVGTGAANSAATQIGVPLENSPDMVPSLFIQSFGVSLNFLQTGMDAAQATGILASGDLPSDLTGVPCSVSLGTFKVNFSLDANGAYKSDVGKTPEVDFTVVRSTGNFVFAISSADLTAAMAALGANNATVNAKDNVIVVVPVSITVGGFSATAKCGFLYRAVLNNTGSGSYIFLSTGNEISGSLLITKFTARETTQKSNGSKLHAFTVQGQFIAPNAAAIVPSPDGMESISIGGYTQTIPASSFLANKGSLKFTGKHITSGMTQFSVSPKGKFSLKYVKVPAVSSGLPIANSGDNILNVDLNLSLQFDLGSGNQLQTGRFIFINRANAAATAWVLRH